MATPPKIDGVIDDKEWEDVPSFGGLLDSSTGQPMEEGGTFWLAYDEKFVYFAARLVDKDPSRIEATEYRTNVSLSGDDFIELALDPFNTYSESNEFLINPRGATNLQIAGGRAAKREWLGEFLAHARITENGWEAEARIPWSIMRLPAAGMHDLNFNVVRSHRRIQRSSVYAYTSGGRVQNVPQWSGVDVPAVRTNTLKLLPYGYLGYDDGETISNGGLDARMSITDRLEAVGSINPDFRNIENQILSLDFSYFERLAGESRPFFLEGSEFFGTSRDAPIFVSQRIQKFDTGLKIYGKVTPNTDLGIINTTNFGDDNALVGRANIRFEPRKNLVVAFTDLQRDGQTNSSSFFSYSHGVGHLTFFGQMANSKDFVDGDGHRYNTGFVYGNEGLNGSLEYIEISPKYATRLGFVPERDLKGFTGQLGYKKPMNWHNVIEAGYSVAFQKLRDFNGNSYRSSYSASTTTTLRDGTDIDTFFSREDFRGHHDHLFDLSIEKPLGNPYRWWEIDYSQGDLAGLNYRSEHVSLAYRPIQPLQLRGYVQHVKYGNDNSHQFILSGIYDIGNDQSINGRMVTRGSDTNFYIAFRRSGNRGAEYFLIFGDPNAQRFRPSLTFKVSVPFEIR